jgi:hypothetical protein
MVGWVSCLDLGRPAALVLLVDDAHHLSLDDDALEDDLDRFGHGLLVLVLRLRGDRAADGRARAAEA